MRNLGLDILRFIAVFLVLGRHCHHLADSQSLFKAWHDGGWVGVDLFFVISGFLVSSILFKEYRLTGTVDLTKFLIRRGFKIYPSFWFVTLFSILFFRSTGQAKPHNEIIYELLFIQNYFPGIWLYTWSLAVEEHFYLGLSLIFKFLKILSLKQCLKLVPWLCLATCAFTLHFRSERINQADHYFYFMYAFLTHLRIDSLCFGVIISYLANFRNLLKKTEQIHPVFLITPGILLIFPAFIVQIEIHRWVLVWGVVIFYLGSGLLVLGSLKLTSSKNKLLTFLGTLGSASYSIYLWHIPIQTWFLPGLKKLTHYSNPTAEITVYFLLSFLVGWVMYLLIEKPSLKLRDYFYKSIVKPLSNDTPLCQFTHSKSS